MGSGSLHPSQETIRIRAPLSHSKADHIKKNKRHIILGILSPESGSLIIDDQLVTDQSMRSWQEKIGYVPQNIYLADASVAENIAFGIESDQIDREKVKKAAIIANLHAFIQDEMPKGYEIINLRF